MCQGDLTALKSPFQDRDLPAHVGPRDRNEEGSVERSFLTLQTPSLQILGEQANRILSDLLFHKPPSMGLVQRSKG